MKPTSSVGIEDFLDIRSISGIVYSPDGLKIAFLVHKPDLDANQYQTSLWIWEKETGKPRELCANIKAQQYIWIDSCTILFSGKLSEKFGSRIESGETWTVFSALNVATLQQTELFGIPLAVKKIVKTGNDAFIFSATRGAGQPPTGSNGLRGISRNAEAHGLKAGKDFEIVDRLPIWSDGAGFVRGQLTGLYLYKGSGEPVPLTDENTNVEMFSVKGNEVIFAGRSVEAFLERSGIFSVNLETGTTRNVVPQNRYLISYIDFLGGSIVFIGIDKRTGLKTDNPKFYRMTGTSVGLWADTAFSVKDTVGYDCKYGDSAGFRIVDGVLYCISTRERSSVLVAIDEAGTVKLLTDDDGAVHDFDICHGEIAFCGIRGMGLQEMFLLSDGTAKKLTGMNTWALDGKTISQAETMVFRNNGFDVHYIVCKPADFDSNKKYPAILYIHGGAKTLYGPVFFHEMQVLAGRGFFVIYGNPRGSDGQGSEFARLKGKYGQFDFEDMMKAMDTALVKYPQIDAERLGVAGGSYGGIMVNWTIGHSTRFKCAVSARSLCNMISAFGTADNGYDFVREQMDASPWENLDRLWEQSPLKYAANIKTPLLLVHSDQDYRCHHSESIQFFTALQYFGVEAKLLLIRGESHSLSRTGRPKQRILRLNEIVDWLEGHLKGDVA